ncbi:MAG: UDP-N-acetylmuramoyl-L-alanine--D-glutamate ligase [Bacteroidota bacterium]
MMDASRVRDKRCTIIGAARSGTAAALLLRRWGARVFVTEAAPAEKLPAAERFFRESDIPCEFGGHSPGCLEADLVVLSPGVPSDAAVVREALGRGIPVASELEAASWFCRAPIVAVTGTNGKTTTTALLGRMFADARAPHRVGGNIGTAFSSFADAMSPRETAILEVSSFQLDHCSGFRPAVAVILNITPDHLDRYGNSFERYADAKSRIFSRMGDGDVLVYNADDPVTADASERNAPAAIRKLPFSTERASAPGAFLREEAVVLVLEGKEERVLDAGAIGIPGRHNCSNALAALLAARTRGIPLASLRATLENFRGVEHRLEFVREIRGVAYVNDSKATNVDAVLRALESFTRPLVLLLGGRDKGNEYGRMVEPVRRRVRAIVAIGESARKVALAFRDVVPVEEAGNMEDAVRRASDLAAPGSTVLLSPGCASFDWFENYEHRGRCFKDIVGRLA